MHFNPLPRETHGDFFVVTFFCNLIGLRDDPGYEDAIRIETALGIPVVRHDDKKPGGIKDVLEFFDGKGTDGEKVSNNLFGVKLGMYDTSI